jgi:hypothetical protein
MSERAAMAEPSGYVARVSGLVQQSTVRLLRPASHQRASVAARRLARQSLVLVAIGGITIAVLMVWLDAYEIALMPPRGSPGLWPARILTDFGKDANVVGALVAMLIAIALVLPLAHGSLRLHLLRLGLNLEFFLAAVVVPLLAGELIKWVVGRGRPFVGQSLQFRAFRGNRSLFQLPVGACDHQRSVGLCHFRGMAAGKGRDDHLRGRDCGDPPCATGPPSERRGRWSLDRADWRDVRAVLVRRARSGVCHPP